MSVYHKSKQDTNKIEAINFIIENCWDDEVWPKYNLWILYFVRDILAKDAANNNISIYLKYLGNALSNVGYSFDVKGNMVKALDFYQKALIVQTKANYDIGMATTLNNMANIYSNQGDIKKCLEYYHKALMIQEKIGDKGGMAFSLNNIGVIYDNQGDIEKGLEYYQKCLKLMKEIGNDNGIAASLNNIGSIYDFKKDTALALKYYQESLLIRVQMNDKRSMASCYNNIGAIYRDYGDIEKGLEYYLKALKIKEDIGDLKGIPMSLHNVGNVYLLKKDINNSMKYALRNMEVSLKLGFPLSIENAAQLLSNIYYAKGDGMKALEMYKLYVQMKDSIINEETQKATIRQQTQYEFEKEQILNENIAKEQARLKAEVTTRRNNLQYSLIFLGILLLFGVVLSLGFIKVSPNVAEGLIFFAFLILFEFILVFTEPYLQDYTNGEPMYNLLANSVLALMIFPVHAILEKLLKKRIVKS